MKLPVTLLLFTVLLVSFGCVKERQPIPPAAQVRPHETAVNNMVLEDDYYWLRERGSKEVLDYLKAENVYADAIMAKHQELRTAIYNEILDRLNDTDESVPYKFGDFVYYERTIEGKDYPIYCRKKGLNSSDEEIYLDANALSEGYDYLDVGMREVSPNDDILAYATDTSGNEIYTIYFKNLKSGELMTDQIPGVYPELAWASDNKTVFYLTLDETRQPYRLYKHVLGTHYTNDELLYEEMDKKFWVSVSRSKSGKYIFLSLNSSTSSEIHYLRSDKPNLPFTVFRERKKDIEYTLYHIDERFLILTNEDAVNFKLLVVPEKQANLQKPELFLPYNPEHKIDGVETFEDYAAIYYRAEGFRQLDIIDLKTKETYTVPFSENVYTYNQGDNYDFKAKALRFEYSSPITPKNVIDVDLKTHQQTILKEDKVLGGFDKNNYETALEYAVAGDGAKVPISMVYKKGLKLDGTNPVFLYGYGAYGISSEARFRSYAISLLDRGFIFAIAHVRGGGEMGRQWYLDGKLLNKKNTFSDFIACSEHLIDKKYTSEGKIIAYGASAGGILMGAIANMRPDLYGGIIGDVPFVDVINTMLDPSIPLTVQEYEEWGNPNDTVYFDYMYSYSPYDNVKAQDYPDMLIMAGLNDPRVQYWEPAKWTAKLRSLKTDKNLLLFKTNMGAGHGGSSARYEAYDRFCH